jgi:Domain of unknown function (DUF4260)
MKNSILYQRLEGASIFLAASTVYFVQDFSVIGYLVLLFIFDIFMGGYLVGNRFGAHLYNIGHSYILPSLVITLYVFTDSKWLLVGALLWFAHIGLDRALGYGLKSNRGFKHTHLGDIRSKNRPT